MDFDEIMSTMSAEAMAAHLVPTSASSWRKMCRTYSKKFHTPLHEVMLLSAEEVALHVFEDNLDEQEDSDGLLENILDLVYTLSDPEYAAAKEAELEEFIEVAREEEIERIKAGRPIHPSLRPDADPVSRHQSQAGTARSEKNSSDVDSIQRPVEGAIPRAGVVDLTHLDENENER